LKPNTQSRNEGLEPSNSERGGGLQPPSSQSSGGPPPIREGDGGNRAERDSLCAAPPEGAHAAACGKPSPRSETAVANRRHILHAEVIGKYDRAGDANKLVYSPLPTPHSFHATRRYTLEFDGSIEAAHEFVQQTLVEEVSQEARLGETPALTGFSFIIDYRFKPGVLDLEKEMILSYYRGLKEPRFTLRQLTITQRIYIFARHGVVPPERFVRDIVNPAIHRHSIITGG
jgi:hypothetical protein